VSGETIYYWDLAVSEGQGLSRKWQAAEFVRIVIVSELSRGRQELVPFQK
jgi:hypothetical protein